MNSPRSLTPDEVKNRLTPLLARHRFAFAANDEAPGVLRWHVDGPDVQSFADEHPDLYEPIAHGYGPQTPPCLDLFIDINDRTVEFEGMDHQQLARFLSWEVGEEFATSRDNPDAWLDALELTLRALLGAGSAG